MNESRLKNLIYKSKYSEIAHHFDGCYIFLDPNWKRILVSVSGGADSALLLFLLCKLISEKNLHIEIFVSSIIKEWWTKPWQIYHARQVVDHIKKKHPNLSISSVEYFLSPEINNVNLVLKDKSNNFRNFGRAVAGHWVDYFCLTNQIPAYFSGLTHRPYDSTFTVDANFRNYINEDPSKLLDILIFHKDLYYIHPFCFQDKSWIIKQYIKNNILELLDLTRSCEGDKYSCPQKFKNLNHKTYVYGQAVPECHECFWCLERKWALSKSDIK